jgi:DNA replication and repair protein RecF
VITDIHLQKFRSFSDDAFDFSPGVNIIVGPNASGKSNILEALLLESLGVSYRTQNNEEMVQFDQPWSRVDVHTQNGQRSLKLERLAGVVKKSFEIDRQKFHRLNFAKTIPTVLFEPRHLQLLTTRPDLRRDYLDDLLGQIVVGFSRTRKDYKRVLTQRNVLLKNHSLSSNEQFFAWNIRLSDLGGQIALQRQKLIDILELKVGPLYKELSNTKDNINIEYTTINSVEDYSNQMLRKLEANKQQDITRGYTSSGPHRDDIKITINKRLIQDVASRGESRTILLTMKIMELDLLEQVRETKPLLLLDDVFSELDGARRSSLTKFLNNYQTFITTTDADVVVQHFTDDCNIVLLGK